MEAAEMATMRCPFCEMDYHHDPMDGMPGKDEMNINGNHVDLRISDVKYTTVQKDPQWGIEMKFHRDYSEATGGKVRLYLCEQLVDLSKPVEITINGKKVFSGKVKASLQSMVSSCAEYFDPCRVYPAYIDLAY